MKILVLDDDIAHSKLICSILQQYGHDVAVAADGAFAVRLLAKDVVDLVILEWTVPVMTGLDVLRWIRSNIGNRLPVFFLTSRRSDHSTVEALNSGADDYVVKPIARDELIARVDALGRRVRGESERLKIIKVGEYVLDRKLRSVTLRGVSIRITNKEFEIAAMLFNNLGVVVSREHLGTVIWGRPVGALSRSIDTHIYRVRSKLSLSSENGLELKSVYSIGYRLEFV
ncbi:response regulator transcription factor [Burkholderia cepacia]|uniref:response regulator transcription factor n=1 Tax=Burkholderia cepacia TaxID=292 RepID=UPI0009C0A7E3|nr:response regulator transcription factor [Burkholderia cepacia]